MRTVSNTNGVASSGSTVPGDARRRGSAPAGGPPPRAGRELEPDAHRLDDEQDVGEEDRRVDTEAIDRLEGDRRRRVRVPAEFEEAEPLPHRPVLGQERPACRMRPRRE